MQTFFVRVECDVTAKVHEQPLRYRAYVNNELFAERTWIWENCYLEENFQISAPAGVYPIRFETVDEDHGRIKVRNYRVVTGPGRIIEYQGETVVEISNESK
jgi:hypothetical protein